MSIERRQVQFSKISASIIEQTNRFASFQTNSSSKSYLQFQVRTKLPGIFSKFHHSAETQSLTSSDGASSNSSEAMKKNFFFFESTKGRESCSLKQKFVTRRRRTETKKVFQKLPSHLSLDARIGSSFVCIPQFKKLK